MIKQNVVFVENKAGSLKRVTGILADNGINIYGFACFDAPEFAIFRMICNDPDKAEIVLNRSGYMNRITQAIVVDMKDQVGGLDELLKVASGSSIQIETLEKTWATITNGIEETRRIQEDARKKRQEDQVRLEAIKQDFNKQYNVPPVRK